MEDLVIETGSSDKKQYAPLPEDYYTVQLNKVTKKDQAVYKQPNQTEKVLEFEFVVLDDVTFEDPELGEQNTKGRRLWKTVRPKLNPPFDNGSASLLYEIVCAVFKQNYDNEQCKMLSTNPQKLIENMLNKQLRVSIAHYIKKNGSTGEKITRFTKATKELEPYVAPVKEETGIDKPLTQSTEEQQETVNDSELPF